MVDAAKVAADVILASRAWAVAAHDDNHNNDSKEGNPPIPNNAAASGGGDNNDALSADKDAIRGCLCMLNKETTLLWEASTAEKHKLLTKLRHRRVAGQILIQPL
jgi:hypothetical protein